MYKIFDIHTHIYPEAIADKATKNLGNFYNFHVDGAGILEDLEKTSKEGGVSGFLLLSVATNTHQVEKVNTTTAECVKKASENGFIAAGFAGIHQDYQDMEREVSRISELGLKGIKIHPDIQGVDIDDNRLLALYEIIEGKMPLYLHMGDDRPQYRYSEAKKLLKVLKMFPKLEVVAAHLGGYKAWDDAIEYLAGLENVWFDTSSALWAMSAERADYIISKLGTERMMFGTDYPTVTAKDELERFFKLRLSEKQKEDILYNNAVGFLRLNDK